MKKTSGTFFPGNALFTIFQHKVLQGSVATYVNYGRIFIDVFYWKFTADCDRKRILKIG